MKKLTLLSTLLIFVASLAWAGWPSAGNGYPSCSQANSFISRLSVSPTPSRAQQYKQFICNLVTAGTWAKLDVVYFLAAENSSTALTNMVSSSFTATVSGTIGFGPGAGYQPEPGSGGYVNTNFIPSTAGGHFTQNSASYGVVINDSRPFPIDYAVIGAVTSGGVFDYILPLWSDGKSYGELGTSANINVANSGTAGGTWILSRTGASAVALYHDGASIVSGATTSVSVPDRSVVIGANYSATGVGAAGNYSGDIISLAFVGGGLTSTDVTNITNAVRFFKPINQRPPISTLWGFTSNTFHDTFSNGLAGIDVNNTLAGGFNWYVSPFFGQTSQVPSASDFTYAGGMLSINGSTNATTYRARILSAGDTSSFFTGTIAASVLTVTAMATGPSARPIAISQIVDGNGVTAGTSITSLGTGTGGVGTYNLSVSSTVAVAVPMTGKSMVGTTFSPGGYYEVCYNIDPSLVPASEGTSGFNAAWTQDLVGLYSQNLTATYGMAASFLEIDNIEHESDGTVGHPTWFFADHEWINTYGGGFGTDTPHIASFIYTKVANPAATHCYGNLWVKTTQNSGTGIIERIVDGAIILSTRFTYNSSSTAFTGESGAFVLMVDGPYHVPTNVVSVNVWH